VDDTLFKVHRFFFERDSEIFRNLVPGADGKTEGTAFCLEVHKDEFVTLLDFFYNGSVIASTLLLSHLICQTGV
jgi:hypothetical protein